jgi:hypothetical protein
LDSPEQSPTRGLESPQAGQPTSTYQQPSVRPAQSLANALESHKKTIAKFRMSVSEFAGLLDVIIAQMKERILD